jgi:hypothetical protein
LRHAPTATCYSASAHPAWTPQLGVSEWKNSVGFPEHPCSSSSTEWCCCPCGTLSDLPSTGSSSFAETYTYKRCHDLRTTYFVLHEGVEEGERDVSVALRPSAPQVVNHQSVRGSVFVPLAGVVFSIGYDSFAAVRHLRHRQAVTLLHGLSQGHRLDLRVFLEGALQPDFRIVQLRIHVDYGPLGFGTMGETIVDRYQRQHVL